MNNESPDNRRPMLVYDGDCGFCKYWVNYLRKLTADSVDYESYQQVDSKFPDISIEEFRHAVQYITPDGKTASAAEAIFLTMSHASGKAFWLWLYRNIPGFTPVSEHAYRFIAAHRSVFFRISLLLWGRDHQPPQYDLVAWIFLRLLGVIFLIAFVSFGVQAMGLIGSHGILPLSDFTTAAHNHIGSSVYWRIPMFFWLNDSDVSIQLVCWSGALMSVLLAVGILPRLSLVFLYALYLSLVYAGQIFMSYQWDILLIETAFLALLMCFSLRWGIWLLRWLMFRLMFGSGIAKIFSGDITWRNFTALNYHFETQPLPTPLSWYMHHLPERVLAFGTGATLFIEIFLPFLIFCPRRLRFFAAFAFLLLQISIFLTGNYGFFNLTAMLLCLPLFDDAAIRRILPQYIVTFIKNHAKFQKPQKIVSIIIAILALWTVSVSLIQIYERYIGRPSSALTMLDKMIEPLQIVNTYGLFAVMTTTRMEIVIEGSDDGIHWKEYGFKYKPSDIAKRPPWNSPYMPRLDWQMWFAALEKPQDNYWFVQFLTRLLENDKQVTRLLEYNPFPDKAPVFIRAAFYEYRFSKAAEKKKNGVYWQREFKQLYFPEVRLKNPTVN